MVLSQLCPSRVRDLGKASVSLPINGKDGLSSAVSHSPKPPREPKSQFRSHLETETQVGNSKARFFARLPALDLYLMSLDPTVLCQLLQVALMSFPGERFWGDDRPPQTPGCSAGLEGVPATDFQLVTGACGFFLLFSESDSDLEPVGVGIQHLQKLSQELDMAIVAEER